jgi:hypothetical protein
MLVLSKWAANWLDHRRWHPLWVWQCRIHLECCTVPPVGLAMPHSS